MAPEGPRDEEEEEEGDGHQEEFLHLGQALANPVELSREEVAQAEDDRDAEEDAEPVPEQKAHDGVAIDPREDEGGGAKTGDVAGDQDDPRPPLVEEAPQLLAAFGREDAPKRSMGERRIAELSRHEIEEAIGQQDPAVADGEPDPPSRHALPRESPRREEDHLLRERKTQRTAQKCQDHRHMAAALEELLHVPARWGAAAFPGSLPAGATGRRKEN